MLLKAAQEKSSPGVTTQEVNWEMVLHQTQEIPIHHLMY
jgi:hypothetical protein